MCTLLQNSLKTNLTTIYVDALIIYKIILYYITLTINFDSM